MTTAYDKQLQSFTHTLLQALLSYTKMYHTIAKDLQSEKMNFLDINFTHRYNILKIN